MSLNDEKQNHFVLSRFSVNQEENSHQSAAVASRSHAGHTCDVCSSGVDLVGAVKLGRAAAAGAARGRPVRRARPPSSPRRAPHATEIARESRLVTHSPLSSHGVPRSLTATCSTLHRLPNYIVCRKRKGPGHPELEQAGCTVTLATALAACVDPGNEFVCVRSRVVARLQS